jgi:hypothetical protein
MDRTGMELQAETLKTPQAIFSRCKWKVFKQTFAIKVVESTGCNFTPKLRRKILLVTKFLKIFVWTQERCTSKTKMCSSSVCNSSRQLHFFFFFFLLTLRGAASNFCLLWLPRAVDLRYPAHRYHAVPSPGFEPTTLWLRVRHPNHSATTLLVSFDWGLFSKLQYNILSLSVSVAL